MEILRVSQFTIEGGRERERETPSHFYSWKDKAREGKNKEQYTHCAIITLTCTTTYYLYTMYIIP